MGDGNVTRRECEKEMKKERKKKKEGIDGKIV